MSDIWSIIGISSLVAAVVTVVLGTIKDILMERYRFKRQSEAKYLESQVKLYSQLYFLSKRLTIGATTSVLFEKVPDAIKNVNKIIEEKTELLAPEFLNEWLSIMKSLGMMVESKAGEQQKKRAEEAERKMKELIQIIRRIMNNTLIPKYRKIVGETVPDLD